MKSKLKKGMYISFDMFPDTIYKILDLDRKYVFVQGDTFAFWERREYISLIITFENMTVEKYVDC